MNEKNEIDNPKKSDYYLDADNGVGIIFNSENGTLDIIKGNLVNLETKDLEGLKAKIKENIRLQLIKNAYCSLKWKGGLYKSMGSKYNLTRYPYNGPLGDGIKYRLSYRNGPEGKIEAHSEVVIYADADGTNSTEEPKGGRGLNKDFRFPVITIESIFTNKSSDVLEVEYLSPLNTTASDNGGVFIGDSPESSIIFENGLGALFEFFVNSKNASEESDSSMMELIYSKKDISDNLLVGAINLEGIIPDIITNDEEDEGLKTRGNDKSQGKDEGEKEREGIAEFRAQLMFPFPKKLFPNESISTGVWVILTSVKQGPEGKDSAEDKTDNSEIKMAGFKILEKYADLIAKYNRIYVNRYDIPHGWNSWGNPIDKYRDYSYVTNINEQIILDNLEVAVKYLKPYGLKYWQLDDGYNPKNIMDLDEINAERFPHGLKYIADKIHEKGLKAGIWINPFNVGIKSKFYQENVKKHPEWFPEPDPSFLIRDENWRSLDLTIPEVQERIKRQIKMVVKEWGYDLLKVDFSYMNMAPTQFQNEHYTAPEQHNLGWKLIREAAGEDKYIIGIGGPIPLHLGEVNAERISLDTLPQWESNVAQHMFDIPQTEGSVIFNLRTMLRKYYLNYRVLHNHNDCLFSIRPSLQKHEALSLAMAVGMLGGIWKIADKLVDMKPEDFRIYQVILPQYHIGARPLDLFEKILPEVLHIHIRKPSVSWDIIGVFNWGANKDLINDKIVNMQEKSGSTTTLESSDPYEIIINFRDIKASSKLFIEEFYSNKGVNIDNEDLNKYHIFDFWSESYLGIFEDHFSIDSNQLPPRHSQIISVVPFKERPQYLSSNRHITQGGIEIGDIIWDEKTSELTTIILPTEGHHQKLYYFIPDNYKFEELAADQPGYSIILFKLDKGQNIDQKQVNIHESTLKEVIKKSHAKLDDLQIQEQPINKTQINNSINNISGKLLKLEFIASGFSELENELLNIRPGLLSRASLAIRMVLKFSKT
ncbi:MAG: glycoside hydrolase family 36 protein [Promethearchaeota archaeon]